MIVLIIQNIQNPKLLAYFKQNSFQRGIWYLGCSDRVPMLKHTAQQVKHYNKTKSVLMNLVSLLNWDHLTPKGTDRPALPLFQYNLDKELFYYSCLCFYLSCVGQLVF